MEKEKQQEKESQIAALVVDPDTGEITDQIYAGDRIVRKSQDEYLANTVPIGKGKGFVKSFDDVFPYVLQEDLSGHQLKVLLLMANNIRYESGLVAFRNGVPLTVEYIAEFLGISMKSVYTSIDKLASMDVISKSKNGHKVRFFANPYIWTRGVRINKTLEAMFVNSKWKKIYDAGGFVNRRDE